MPNDRAVAPRLALAYKKAPALMGGSGLRVAIELKGGKN